MANPTDFLLNTDYEMDKIVYFKEGEFTEETEFNHGLNYIPLVFGVWSTDKSFSSTNTLGVQPYGSYDPNTTPLCVSISVNGSIGDPDSATTIELSSKGKDSATTKIYYRIYAFAPPDYKGNTATTSSKAHQFILNTDYNYRKLKSSGKFTQNGDEYVHNLGYCPHVMAWERASSDNSFWVTPLVYSSPGKFGLEITNQKIRLILNSSTFFDELYWRMYYDEG